MKKSHLLGGVCAVLFSFFTVSANAAAVLDVQDGQLVGATGVSVNGVLYDVEFVDGSCVTLFNGCDDPGDFVFTSGTEALAASQALLDQVFLGIYDTNPELTAGCSFFFDCDVLTAYALMPELPAIAFNFYEITADYVALRPRSIETDTSPAANAVYASWAPATSIVEIITIDIKPRKNPKNVIDLKMDRELKVAIVGAETFDALQVDPATIKFGPIEAGPVNYKVRDYNRDGFSDLILRFNLSETGIDCGDVEATLTGETYSGDAIQGSDSFTVERCQ